MARTKKEPEMQMFVCSGCNTKLFDTKHYFTGVESTKCMWCTRWPKPKKIEREKK